MHRNQLLDYLKSYQQTELGRTQVDLIHQFTKFVTEHSDCFERTCIPGHITGSAWVIDPTGEKVLLTHHKKLGRWLQLGGHCDGDANVQEVAIREVKEESGLVAQSVLTSLFDIDLHLIPAIQKNGKIVEPSHFHYDVRFLLQASDREPLALSEESNDLRWVGALDLIDLSQEESLLRMNRKWLSIKKNILRG